MNIGAGSPLLMARDSGIGQATNDVNTVVQKQSCFDSGRSSAPTYPHICPLMMPRWVLICDSYYWIRSVHSVAAISHPNQLFVICEQTLEPRYVNFSRNRNKNLWKGNDNRTTWLGGFDPDPVIQRNSDLLHLLEVIGTINLESYGWFVLVIHAIKAYLRKPGWDYPFICASYNRRLAPQIIMRKWKPLFLLRIWSSRFNCYKYKDIPNIRHFPKMPLHTHGFHP